jgi:hypothetical protein
MSDPKTTRPGAPRTGGRGRARRTVSASAVAGALFAALAVVLMPASGGTTGHVLAAASAQPSEAAPARSAGRDATVSVSAAVSLNRVASSRVERLLQAVHACPDEARACVDTGLRLSWLQDDGSVVYGPVRIMPGTPSLPGAVATPHGVFHVQWKDADHVSGEFGEPMPNAVFFAPGGIAFHAGSLTAGSHGCVHLSRPASRYYYTHLPVGAEVAVFS